jgi:hypothetical protein
MKTPIAIFLFKRIETLERIFSAVRNVKPEKIYLLADGPRDEYEKYETDNTRKKALQLIDWNCEIIKNFHETNVGVYRNIGEGANFVFNTEKEAIFLEDDSLPDGTFFRYCEELLEKYRENEDVLWICGTNYIESDVLDNDKSYFFTRNLLPCGWASWSHKFNKYYDGELANLNNLGISKMKLTYVNNDLYRQELNSIMQTKYLLDNKIGKASWDRQMCYAVRSNGLYGISPRTNLIKNIGVDNLSIHGGSSMSKTMTKRFCELNTIPLSFPLNHPEYIGVERKFENETEKIILYPLKIRLLILVGDVIKKILNIKKEKSLTLIIKELIKK